MRILYLLSTHVSRNKYNTTPLGHLGKREKKSPKTTPFDKEHRSAKRYYNHSVLIFCCVPSPRVKRDTMPRMAVAAVPASWVQGTKCFLCFCTRVELNQTLSWKLW